MVVPIVAGVLIIARLAIIALSVYEALDVLSDIYEGLDKYNKGVDEAKKQIDEMIQDLKKEIDELIDQKEQVAILLAASSADPQNEVTKQGRGRGSDKDVIQKAIQQKIPFRRVISEVCEKADSMPVVQLRRKKGVTISDIKGAKRKALEEILRRGLDEIADVDLDDFILVCLKQFAASLMLEFVDHCLDWASPLKCEVTFGPKPGYSDHPVDGATRLKRVGKVSPFYPFPPPNNRRGSLSADLIINEYRKERTDKNNIFAIVEIKFPRDKIDEEQFNQYAGLLERAAAVKTARSPVRFEGREVSSGGRLALFRYPEDRPAAETEKEKKEREAAEAEKRTQAEDKPTSESEDEKQKNRKPKAAKRGKQ